MPSTVHLLSRELGPNSIAHGFLTIVPSLITFQARLTPRRPFAEVDTYLRQRSSSSGPPGREVITK